MDDQSTRRPYLIEVAIEPKNRADQGKLRAALEDLAREDPSFQVSTDAESGQTILKGTDELHLESKIDLLHRTYKVDANVGAPQVAYRETISRAATIDYTHKKQTGGSGQFARVKIEFEPLEAGSGFVFKNAVVGGAVPKEFVPGVEKGLKAQKESGLLAGFPLIDFKATLIDGAYHDVDSNVLTFEIASRAALRELAQKGGPKLLEPIMKVEVVTPGEYLEAILADLNRRRARVEVVDRHGDARAIAAEVPLANMFSYFNTLRSMSQGQARLSMTFDHYEQIPPNLTDDDPPFSPATGMRMGNVDGFVSLISKLPGN